MIKDFDEWRLWLKSLSEDEIINLGEKELVDFKEEEGCKYARIAELSLMTLWITAGSNYCIKMYERTVRPKTSGFSDCSLYEKSEREKV